MATRNAELNCRSFYVKWKRVATPDNMLTFDQGGALFPFFFPKRLSSLEPCKRNSCTILCS
ncbi:hypothetical protein E2C01_058100 [Portunus trituberculatus]|uniref:Uncharacterized protein n=1 Tax=Portunus trituberculatus TaxID=210409 RepID=A0A5B7GUP6_PORTR|nr:hypothetical protein [Portunus trituberculatus]